jgi:DnaJ-class molecular chaperone
MSNQKEIICTNCNGSGEGQYDGTTCHYCKGRGTQLIEIESEDSEDSEDFNTEEIENDSD